TACVQRIGRCFLKNLAVWKSKPKQCTVRFTKAIGSQRNHLGFADGNESGNKERFTSRKTLLLRVFLGIPNVDRAVSVTRRRPHVDDRRSAWRKRCKVTLTDVGLGQQFSVVHFYPLKSAITLFAKPDGRLCFPKNHRL